MVTLPKFLLAITLYWNKINLPWLGRLFALAIVSAPLLCLGQGRPGLVSDQGFNESFFEAQSLKLRDRTDTALSIFQELYRLEPNNATICYELAQLYAGTGNREDAIFYGERAHDLAPENEWMSLLLAAIYKQFGESEKQLALYQKLVEDKPQDEQRQLELAQAYFNNGLNKEGFSVLDQLEEQIGLNEIISDLRRSVYLEEGDLKKAISELEKLIEAYPNNMNYRGSLAQLYEANGLEEEAFEVYLEMVAQDSTDPRPHLDLANHYRMKGQYERSLHHLKQAMASPLLEMDKKIVVLMSLFEASLADNSLLEEAYQILDQLVQSDPKDPRVFAMYGDYLSRDGKDEEAISYYKKALALEGGEKFQVWEQILLLQMQNQLFDSLAVNAPKVCLSYPNQPLPYLFAGIALNQKSEYEKALNHLEDGLAYVLGNQALKEQFYLQLGESYFRIQEYSQSDAYFDKALALNSENATALNNYAYYLSIRGERLDKALSLTEKSNRLSPNNPVFLDTWAWVLYKREEYAAALDKMEKVIKDLPQKDPEVWEHYGDILAANKLFDQAKQAYNAAISAGGPAAALQSKIEELP